MAKNARRPTVRRRRFIAYNRRHRWVLVREYTWRDVYRCRVCGSWTRRPHPSAIVTAVRAAMPDLIRQVYKATPTLAALWGGKAVSGGGGIVVPYAAPSTVGRAR